MNDLSREAFRSTFGIDAVDAFPEEFAALINLELVTERNATY